MAPSTLLLLFTTAAAIGGLVASLWSLRRGRLDREKSEDLMMELLQEELKDQRNEVRRATFETREDLRGALESHGRGQGENFDRLSALQAERLDGFANRTAERLEALERRLAENELKLADGLVRMENESNRRIDALRQVVEDRLEGTLSRRLGDSFAQVSERLDAVQRGLGEMQGLAKGVGDLQRTLTGAKTRGTWGEVQLGALLAQILSPDQYEKNVAVKPDGQERVDFAIKLPGDGPTAPPLWIPLDAKFPLAAYERLNRAQEIGDTPATTAARRELSKALELQAASIRRKYIAPPATTDFALLFLPSEGLYAEALRDGETISEIQERHRVVPVGPTTLAALLNSLRMGFRALAIGRRSGEVRELLSDVKLEFARFGEALERTRKQLGAATNSIEETGRRTRAMERRLADVEHLDIVDEPEGTDVTVID